MYHLFRAALPLAGRLTSLLCCQAEAPSTLSHELSAGLNSARKQPDLWLLSLHVHVCVMNSSPTFSKQLQNFSARVMLVQGVSLSSMTGSLQSLDPLHTAYLDWQLLLRDLVAQALPALPTASADQLLQLKQRMQQADSDADGFLTEAELQAVDMQPLLTAAASTAQTDASTAQTDGSSDSPDGLPNEGGSAGPVTDASAQDGQAQEDTDAAVQNSIEGTGATVKSEAQFKQLLYCMFGSNGDSNAAIGVEEVMLYLCCANDGAEGLQKAFVVLTGSQPDDQVCCFCCCMSPAERCMKLWRLCQRIAVCISQYGHAGG